ncbi:MAG: PTS mannose transporter subunit IIA [Atopobiaceae bacterium]|jgi:PTS system mannose-specific IIA component|nr:PTS mannose transporter subunit IIA [Atopobiaceae bacterium]MCH4120185.1 PTS mannose transporter subunit IIA [Atopobiaceae bacterium]MCI1389254.1 PTS mannose transporter subunit IIA [Atopobiaceae bacterium]MCI1432735.1 PTS mannose transporter subunit IIA [Atopobiaceae bacterium]MCI1471370.1 PTS mannose transporter subunit IIA [Atopobiaceae bacterium]
MKIVLVSHNVLAEGMLKAAEMIGGAGENVAAFGLMPDEDGAILTKKVTDWLDAGEEDPEVLVISDLYFGSPFNAMVALSQTRKFYHITGMNLAMVLEAISMMDDEGITAKDVAEAVLPLSHDGIVDVNEVLANM